jgi:hypothetical protein
MIREVYLADLIFLLLGALSFGVLLSSCDILNDCPECFTPPVGFALRVLDRNDTTDLILSGFYDKDSIAVYYPDGAIRREVELMVYADTLNQRGGLYSNVMPWRSLEGIREFYLYLNALDTDTIYLEVVSVSDNCCTYHVYKNLTINGIPPPADNNGGYYLHLK